MYYLGTSDLPVKPVTKRVTMARGQRDKVCRRYLQKKGRKPVNRGGYPTMGTPVPVSLATEPGQFGLSLPFQAEIKTNYVPSLPVTAPAPSSGGFITSLLNLWNERPQVLKDIRFTVNPNQVAAMAQNVVKPGQVGGFVDLLRKWGITPSYQGVPVTGGMASTGYQLYGMNLGQYLPWIIGGGAALIIAPMLMKKSRR